MMMKAVIPAVLAAGITAPHGAPYAQQPVPGQQRWNWHATAQDANGQTMTCTHLPDSGHLIYGEYGGPRDTQG
jgi:hypothetical protein